MWQRFTQSARTMIFRAQQAAQEQGSESVDEFHFLTAMLGEGECTAHQVLVQLGADLDGLAAEARATSGPPGEGWTLTDSAKRVVDCAFAEAKTLQDKHIGTEHLLLGMLHEPATPIARLLQAHGIDRTAVRVAVLGRKNLERED
jgi:ATP-dependent Clp protease ATP-binding subunit ClpC